MEFKYDANIICQDKMLSWIYVETHFFQKVKTLVEKRSKTVTEN